MCLTVPGRIVALEAEDSEARRARVDFGVAVRTASLLFTPDAVVGDFVIVQAGFATRRLTPAEAEEALAYHRELAELARRDSMTSGSGPNVVAPPTGRA